MPTSQRLACFSVDVEPDCPPFLTGYRGVEQGLPPLLDVLDELGVRGTFFTTGEVALRSPEAVSELVRRGHELGCHGLTHRRFSTLGVAEAEAEIATSAAILRAFAPVSSFRAPNLDFPPAYLGLLEDAGFRADSSQALYKPRTLGAAPTSLVRIPASVTSAVLRLPRAVREAWLRGLRSPVVLFTHPWELVDLRRERLRLDCRFRTGPQALAGIRASLLYLRRRGFTFRPLRELAGHGTAEA